MKKLFTFFLALVASVGSMSAAVVNGTCGDNLTWTVNSKDSTLVIEGSGAMTDYSNGTKSPWYEYKAYIAYVSLPSGLTNIGSYAFDAHSSLKSIVMPNSVTKIGSYALDLCKKLSSITFSENITTIGERAFRQNICTSIVLPESLTSMGNGNFDGCKNITAIKIPDNLTTIEYQTFQNCTSLTNVTIGKSVTSIGSSAFYNTAVNTVICFAPNPPSGGANCNINEKKCILYVPYSSIEIYKNSIWWEDFASILPIPGTEPCLTASGTCGAQGDNLTWELSCDGVLTISGTGAMNDFSYPDYSPWYSYRSSIKSAIINAGVTSIGELAFRACTGLTSVTIPNSVTSIGRYAFWQCSSLMTVTIPNSVTIIDEYAFDSCTGLTSVTIPNSVTSIGGRAFRACAGLTSIEIPESVTSIGSLAFSECAGLNSMSVTAANEVYDSRNNCNAIIESATNTLVAGCKSTHIPSSVTNIGSSAFSYCSGMTSIEIPNSVTGIDRFAFDHCTGLTSIEIPNSVSSIGEVAFQNCTGLTSVTIPNSVTSIGDRAFHNCYGLTSVIWNAKNCADFGYNTVPFNNISSQITSFTFINEVEHIPAYLCNGMSNLTSIEIPNSVTSIGDGAFEGCSVLTSITCEVATPPTLESNVFSSVDKSIPLYVPGRSVDLYKAADQWKDFTNIQAIPGTEPCILASGICGDNVTWELSCDSVLTISGTGSIGSSTPWLNYRLSIKEIILSEGITELKWLCFNRCVNLTNVSFPRSMINIGPNAFQGCQNLRTIVISGNEENGTTIENQAFAGCTNLVSVTFGNVINILGATFEGCTGLSSIEIPQSVTELGFSAFWRCSNLTDINVASGNQTYSSLNGVVFNADTTSLLIYPEGKSGAYTIPHSVITIGAYAFDRCINLTDVTIPLEVTHINSAAFIGCSNLQSITIPKNVNSIGRNAFEGCIGLQSITCEAVTPPDLEWNSKYNSGVFDGVDKSIPLYVPGPSIDLYKAADEWKDFYNILPIPGTELPEYPVIFLDYNSNVLSEQSVEEGSAAVAPNVPAREGYTFVGWNVDVEHIVAPTYAIALYDKIGGTLTYLSEDGDVIATENVDLHLPEAPAIDGKSFKGWLTESADSENGIVLRATYTSDKPDAQEDVTVTPSSNSAYVIFPFITGALTYQLVIRDLFGHVVCKIMFSATGHLLGVAFAPSRNQAQQTSQTTGFNFTVEGLDPSTTYEYEFVANDDTDEVIETLSGSFTTTAEVPTDNEQVNSPSAVRKYLEDGHLMIDANSHIFDTQGKMVR